MPQMIKQLVIKYEGFFPRVIAANIFNYYSAYSVFNCWKRNGVFRTKINLQLATWYAVYLHLEINSFARQSLVSLVLS